MKGFMTVVICVTDEWFTVDFKLTVSRNTVGTQETRVSGKSKGTGSQGGIRAVLATHTDAVLLCLASSGPAGL